MKLTGRLGLLNSSAFVFQLAGMIFYCNSLQAQVQNKGNVFISGDVYIGNSFTNEATSVYQNNGNLYLTGDFVNNQTAMDEGSGTTSFIGTTLQLISGNQSPFFHHVLYNNAAGVQMNSDVSMGGTISPAAGRLYFNDHVLTLGGKMDLGYTNTAAFNVTPLSGLIITGAAATGNNLYFDAAANTFHSLTVSAAGTGMLGNALNIAGGNFTGGYGIVTVDGTFDANGYLTLKSAMSGTALVAPSDGTITHNVTVERHIPPFRAWRFLAVPFASSGQSINAAWQEGAVNTCLTCNVNPNPGYGTQITYDGNTANGFDPNITTNPSLILWDVTNQKWTTYSPPTIGTNIRAYSAYNVFVRGSRANDLSKGTSAIPDTTTLRIAGVLNETGNSVSSGTLSGTSGQYVLIGNPFAAPLNVIDAFNSSGTTGVDKTTFTVMDPKFNNDGRNVGAYVVYKKDINNWVPFGISYPNGYPPVVQSGQGLMVKLSGSGTHEVQFQQANKYTGEQINVFGLAAKKIITKPVIYTNLMAKAQTKDSLCIVDGIAAGFSDGYSEGVDSIDAPKLWNIAENIALVRNSVPLAIEMRNLPTASDTLFYRLYIRQQPYILKIFSQDLSDISSEAWIVDKYLDTQTEINLKDTTLYSFTPNTDTNSYRNRFMLVFKPSAVKKDILTTVTAKTKTKAKIYPNPVSGKTFNLVTEEAGKGNYTVNIFTTSGKLIATRTLSYEAGKNMYNIKLPAAITAGTYIVQIMNEKDVVVGSLPIIIAGNKN